MSDRMRLDGKGKGPIRITDLLPTDSALRPLPPTIGNMDFIDCFLVGPAVIVPIHSDFDGLNLSEPMHDVLWDLKMDDVAVGAVAVEKCSFVRCRFQRIGIAGPIHLTNWFRAMEVEV